MRNFLAALVGAIAGAVFVTAIAVAASNPASHMSGSSAMPMAGATGSMMSGAASAAMTKKLTIIHVKRGCHVWSNGTKTAATMRLHLMRGDHLSITDMDVDAHQMMQFSGPAHLRMGGPMMMNQGVTFTFRKSGVYRLGTRTVEMPGAMEAETIGPDNHLRLVVTVG